MTKREKVRKKHQGGGDALSGLRVEKVRGRKNWGILQQFRVPRGDEATKTPFFGRREPRGEKKALISKRARGGRGGRGKSKHSDIAGRKNQADI